MFMKNTRNILKGTGTLKIHFWLSLLETFAKFIISSKL